MEEEAPPRCTEANSPEEGGVRLTAMTDKAKLEDLQDKIAIVSSAAQSVDDLVMSIHLLCQTEGYQPLGKRPRLSSFVSNPPGQAIESFEQLKEEDSSSMDVDESEDARYLVVSSGCAICFLDLKKRDGVPILDLPKIATLNLIENRLPVVVGLFRRGSEIYMIGGRDFLEDVKPPHSFLEEGDIDFDLFRFFLQHWKGDIKGTCCATRRLSVGNGAVNLSECEIGELNRPKFWPKVERIGDKLHVFEHSPCIVRPAKDWVFSHEVLDLGAGSDTSCWRNIEATQAVDNLINSYLVIGNRIYAVASRKCLVFCSETEKWEEVETHPRFGPEFNAFNAQLVWDILKRREAAMCVGKFELQENMGDDLYVVIATGVHSEERGDFGDDVGSSGELAADDVLAVAYLVTSKGVVVCRQMVPQLFEGRVKTCLSTTSKVMKVDEEGKTMCVIVSLDTNDLGSKVCDGGPGYLFINTFTVEMLTHKREVIQKLICEPWNFDTYVEFMRVKIKHRYVLDPVGDKDRKVHDQLAGDGNSFAGDREEYKKWYEGRMREVVKKEADFHTFVGIDACFGWMKEECERW